MQIGNILRLAEERILVEQLRQLLGNADKTLVSAALVAILMVLFLSNDSNALELKVWGATVILTKFYSAYYARRTLASGISSGQSSRLTCVLITLYAVYGVEWGALAWVTLDTTAPTEVVLVVAALVGAVATTMSMLSPVLPVFVALVSTTAITFVLKVWLLGNPAYYALGVLSVLYATAMIGLARGNARMVRESIDLRFGNLELVNELQLKTEIAEAAYREAKQANLAKSKFLAAASHDLRQPIHAQGLFLEVLAHSGLTTGQNEVLVKARAASKASAGMLNTLLDFSRIEAGVIEPQVRPFHLQPLLHEIENELAPQANVKGLVFRSRETRVAAQSDPALVELILRNLISNAIRYTEQGGMLVACRRRGDQIMLEVWDTGIGIAPSQQQDIFREFHQLGNAERDRNKGLGLGLAIAQGLARMLGHELSLASTPGRGSVFRLALPVARIAVANDGLKISHSYTHVLLARVLVIDDDEAVRASMLHLLRRWACECVAVESIEEALAAARANRPDIVISDYRLREQRTGAEAIAVLRAEFGAHLPALLITGDTAPERLREAHASGVPLLHKPVSPDQLYRRLVGALADAEDGSSANPVSFSGSGAEK